MSPAEDLELLLAQERTMADLVVSLRRSMVQAEEGLAAVRQRIEEARSATPAADLITRKEIMLRRGISHTWVRKCADAAARREGIVTMRIGKEVAYPRQWGERLFGLQEGARNASK